MMHEPGHELEQARYAGKRILLFDSAAGAVVHFASRLSHVLWPVPRQYIKNGLIRA